MLLQAWLACLLPCFFCLLGDTAEHYFSPIMSQISQVIPKMRPRFAGGGTRPQHSVGSISRKLPCDAYMAWSQSSRRMRGDMPVPQPLQRNQFANIFFASVTLRTATQQPVYDAWHSCTHT
jgi:hypothetical protein